MSGRAGHAGPKVRTPGPAPSPASNYIKLSRSGYGPRAPKLTFPRPAYELPVDRAASVVLPYRFFTRATVVCKSGTNTVRLSIRCRAAAPVAAWGTCE